MAEEQQQTSSSGLAATMGSNSDKQGTPESDDKTSTIHDFFSAVSSVVADSGRQQEQQQQEEQPAGSGPGSAVDAANHDDLVCPSPSVQSSMEPPSSSEDDEEGTSRKQRIADEEAHAESIRKQQQPQEPSPGTAKRESLRQGYFERHPDPDADLRRHRYAGTAGIASSSGGSGSHRQTASSSTGGSSVASNRQHQSRSQQQQPATVGGSGSGSSRKHGSTVSRRDAHMDNASSQSDNESLTGGAGGGNGPLFSPALSTSTTLSAGISIGATMGGSSGERIFPIKSVVAPSQQQRPPPPTQSTSAASSAGLTATPSTSSTSRPYSSSSGGAGEWVERSTGTRSVSGSSASNTYNPFRFQSAGELSPDMQSSSSRHRYFPSIAEGVATGQRNAESEEEPEEAGAGESRARSSSKGSRVMRETFGQDYSRRSPIPDDASDFSFPINSDTGQGSSNSTAQATYGARGPRSSSNSGTSRTGTAMPDPSDSRSQHYGKPPVYRRLDSQATSGVGSALSHASDTLASSSHPTTTFSRMSNDSDPTARDGKGSKGSTAPSTVHSQSYGGKPDSVSGGGQRKTRRRLVRKKTSESQGPGRSASDAEDEYEEVEEDASIEEEDERSHSHDDADGRPKASEDDIIRRAKQAYDEGGAEEGPSVNADTLGSLGTEEDGVYLTVRFEHQETEDGHAILTGRKGQLLRCEDEPIHIPGAIQDYGVLIAVEQVADEHFEVKQVSENSSARLGLSPKLLFSLNCFTDILDEDNKDAFLEAIENMDENDSKSEHGGESSGVPPTYAPSSSSMPTNSLAALNNFQLSGQGSPGSGMEGTDSQIEWTCWCAVHRPDPHNRPKLIIIEFELEQDIMNPLLRERTQEEIDEDRSTEQATSLFGDKPSSLDAQRETAKAAHTNEGDPSSHAYTQEAIPGMGRADGQVPDPAAPASSLPGTLGRGGNNDSDAAAQTSSGVEKRVRIGVHESINTLPPSSPTTEERPKTANTEEGLGESATQEEIDSSTKSRVKPMRALRRLRKAAGSGKSGSDALKLFSILGQINDELFKVEDLQTSLEIAAGVVSEVTGFHRVMIYQFDESWNGQVVAELVDYKQTRDLYRGLHFPASDIPAQARELYKVNKVRLLYDRDQPTARIVCKDREELNTPLDLTHSHLRAMSPIHIKYLANMGVRASMSISIIAFGQLWGLISCHTYGRYGQRVSFPGRQLCRIIGDQISRNIERLSMAQRLQSRKLINTIPTNTNPGGYIIAKAEDLLALFDAEFGVLSIGNEAKILGSLENSQEVLAVLEYLRVKAYDQVQVTTNLVADFPDLDYPSGFQHVAGMLSVPLARNGKDFIAFFRRGQLQHVHWAGNPYDKVMRETRQSKSFLEPRKSFKIWSETIVGKCRAWSDEHIETAAVLRLVYGKFIEVWRQREAALTSSKLTSLLLSNASHEVRTPLNHIINYLEMALEGPLDDDTRESLVRSHSASRALVHVINDLLDLTRTESGQQFFLQDPLDLSETIQEAASMHRLEAERRGIAFEIFENPSGTPQILLGDRGKIRQIIANVTANAVKHTEEGKVTIEWGELPKDIEDPGEASQDTIKIGIAISDTGVGIPEDQLEDMFRTFEQVEMENDMPTPKGGGHLGLGLAVVARIVSQLGGQLRVESKVGTGSKFTFVLHFRLPGPEQNLPPRRPSVDSARERDLAQDAHDRQASGHSAPRGGRRSIEKSTSSGGDSYKSTSISIRSKHSEIDSLVEAISSAPGSQQSITGRPESYDNQQRPGQISVQDTRTPLRSIRMEQGDTDAPQVSGQAAEAQKSYGGARPPMGRRRTSMRNVAAGAGPHLPARPRTLSFDHPSSSPKQSSAPTSPRKLLRVMIVEDDAINRAILYKKLIKDFNFTVKQTVHGEEAVRLYEKDQDFDLVLMDLQMPICDGFTASRRIREFSQSRGADFERHPVTGGFVPVFAVSASLQENQRQQLLDCGFSGFILKPLDFSRLGDLMQGTSSREARDACQYVPGRWEKGGWLFNSDSEKDNTESPKPT